MIATYSSILPGSKSSKYRLIHWSAILLVLASWQARAQTNFLNPIAEQRADPWVYRDDGNVYYLIATVPEYDRIVLRSASTIDGLRDAPEKTLWTKHATGVMGHHIWAPELHRIDGTWYIYFAAGEAENVWNIRMWVLSNCAEDPFTGTWTEEGQIETQRNGFALDATTFAHRGKRYLIWAEGDGDGTSLILSEMADPTTLMGPQIVISRPEFSWERMKYNVNEGPAVLQHGERIFVTYSASATNDNYAMGLLWIDAQADPLDTAQWHKAPAPVFSSYPAVNRYGPGHNSFTVDHQNRPVLIYHARDYRDIEGPELENPDRATRARFFSWTKRGFPDFHQSQGD